MEPVSMAKSTPKQRNTPPARIEQRGSGRCVIPACPDIRRNLLGKARHALPGLRRSRESCRRAYALSLTVLKAVRTAWRTSSRVRHRRPVPPSPSRDSRAAPAGPCALGHRDCGRFRTQCSPAQSEKLVQRMLNRQSLEVRETGVLGQRTRAAFADDRAQTGAVVSQRDRQAMEWTD